MNKQLSFSTKICLLKVELAAILIGLLSPPEGPPAATLVAICPILKMMMIFIVMMDDGSKWTRISYFCHHKTLVSYDFTALTHPSRSIGKRKKIETYLIMLLLEKNSSKCLRLKWVPDMHENLDL